jgi:protein ImuA
MRYAPNIIDFPRGEEAIKTERIAALRKAVDGLQSIPAPSLPEHVAANVEPSLAPGLPASGIPCSVLNEVIAAHADRPAAFAFLFTLMTAALQKCPGPAVFIAARRALDFGMPYGHGLRQFGLDVSRLILIDTKTDKDALWALEETLRSAVKPAIVAGVVETGLGLTQSRRLNLAAAKHPTPLAVLRGEKAMGASAAATRWRLGFAPATCDRFGLFERWRWRATLERCRNGRTGDWLLDWDPVACRFGVVEDTHGRNAVESCKHRPFAISA